MARPPRIDFPDALYHVTSRGNGRQQVLWTNDDRQRFLGQLADGLSSAAIVLHAFADVVAQLYQQMISVSS
ncbi:MAG: hypothetical protein ABSG68_21870 [Thermoguttaceae bacterium]|jgi:hypothetical protein